MQSTKAALALGATLTLAVGASCGPKNDSSNNPSDDNLAAVGSDAVGEDLDLGDDDDYGSEFDEDEGEFEIEAWPKIAKPKKATEKCKGKGKKRECKMVDPTPKISAAHGARSMMGDFRFGMTPGQVFKLMSNEVDAEYEAKQKATSDAMAQDQNRQWRKEQLQSIKANHVQFTQASKHRWGVSLIQFEYEDDSNEEMLWVKANPTLRKFYFFKDDELWKIIYAYSTEAWPGKSYANIVDEKFKKWFGPSPEPKLKIDEKSQKVLIQYNEWESADSSFVRSFDMTAVNGVIVLAVVDKNAEDRIGERLPNLGRDEKFSDDVSDVLGGSDVCYDDSGEIRECAPGEEAQ